MLVNVCIVETVEESRFYNAQEILPEEPGERTVMCTLIFVACIAKERMQPQKKCVYMCMYECVCVCVCVSECMCVNV